MSTKVAVDGDVTAIAGTTPYPPATSGAWSPGSVTTKTAPKLKAGAAVVHEASCTFTFSGVEAASGAPVNGSESVTLTPGSTRLTSGGTAVLVDGDSADGTYGNKLQVSAAGPLKTE